MVKRHEKLQELVPSGKSSVTEDISWGSVGSVTFLPFSFPFLPVSSINQPYASALRFFHRPEEWELVHCGLCIRLFIFILFFHFSNKTPDRKSLKREDLFCDVRSFSWSLFCFKCLAVVPGRCGCFWSYVSGGRRCEAEKRGVSIGVRKT